MNPSAAWRWIWSQPWLVLGYMTFVAGANGVAARLARDEIPPLALVFLRWLVVCTTLALVLDRPQRDELRILARNHWRRLAWMGLLGYAGFNALFYVAAYHTSAINLTLLQCAIPAFVLAGAALVLHMPVRPLQIAGMLVTFSGVLIVAAKGDLGRLAQLRLDIGDVFVLIACLFYACYTIGLRVRPASTPLVFFAGMAAASLLWALPIGAAEIVVGKAFWPTGKGWLVLLFIAFGPSLTGQLCFMRGVDLIGPARAGLYANLIPIFGALSAIMVLNERFEAAHAVALVLGLGGVALAEWSGREKPEQRPLSRTCATEASDDHPEPAGDASLP